MQKYMAFFTHCNTDKLYAYAQLMRFDRPIGFLLLLWPTLAALWVASDGFPRVDLFLIFSLGVVVMRSAGCVINDYADQDFDGHVERTKNRPIVSGQVTPQEALMLLFCLLVIALILVLFINTTTLYWAMVGASLTIFYPFAKRFTWFPQAVLGVTFAWSIPMAFTATEVGVSELTWLIYFTNLIWIIMYDTIYAMVDREDDIAIGVRSTAILFGDADRMLIGVMQIMALIGMIIMGNSLGFGWVYSLSMALVCALFVWQQMLIKERQPAQCFRAFLNNNYVGIIWFLGVVLEYLLR